MSGSVMMLPNQAHWSWAGEPKGSPWAAASAAIRIQDQQKNHRAPRVMTEYAAMPVMTSVRAKAPAPNATLRAVRGTHTILYGNSVGFHSRHCGIYAYVSY